MASMELAPRRRRELLARSLAGGEPSWMAPATDRLWAQPYGGTRRNQVGEVLLRLPSQDDLETGVGTRCSFKADANRLPQIDVDGGDIGAQLFHRCTASAIVEAVPIIEAATLQQSRGYCDISRIVIDNYAAQLLVPRDHPSSVVQPRGGAIGASC